MSQTENIKAYSSLTEKINKEYAYHHDYDFKMFNEIMTDRAPQWCKIKVINELLNDSKYDYLFWIDADAYFNKKEIKLESFINEDIDKNIIICDDIVNSGKDNTINSGTFFVKCTDWSKEFFKKIWEYSGKYRYDYFHEQTIIENYLKDNIMECRSHIVIKPCRYFNTEINLQLLDNSIHDNFIIHLMGKSSEFRVDFINKYTTITRTKFKNYFMYFIIISLVIFFIFLLVQKFT